MHMIRDIDIILNGVLEQHQGWNASARRNKKLDEVWDILLHSDAFSAPRFSVEKPTDQSGCFVLFLPTAHPMLNPIERFWRFIKSNLGE